MSFTIRRKKGSPFWYARGTIPARQADGSIARIRHEESLRTESKTEARKRAGDLDKYYHDLAYGKIQKRGPTFAEAALTYLQTRGKDDRFLPKLLAFFGETPIADIDQAAIAQAADDLYPNAKASTHNRAVFAPVVTILRLSGIRPDFKRPRVGKRPISIPPDDWFDRVLAASPTRLAALLIFLTLTGRRITEALEAIDNGDGSATIGQTKTGSSVVVAIPDSVYDLLGGEDKRVAGQRLFAYGDRHNVYRELRKVCKAAKLPYFGTHALGRHAFATRLLKQGFSLKHVAEAGGWASIKMVAERYGHLERSEVQESVRKVGEEWSKKRTL